MNNYAIISNIHKMLYLQKTDYNFRENRLDFQTLHQSLKAFERLIINQPSYVNRLPCHSLQYFFARFIHHTAAQFVGGVTLLPSSDFPNCLREKLAWECKFLNAFFCLCENGFGTNCGSAQEAFISLAEDFFSFSKVKMEAMFLCIGEHFREIGK